MLQITLRFKRGDINVYTQLCTLCTLSSEHRKLHEGFFSDTRASDPTSKDFSLLKSYLHDWLLSFNYRTSNWNIKAKTENPTSVWQPEKIKSCTIHLQSLNLPQNCSQRLCKILVTCENILVNNVLGTGCFFTGTPKKVKVWKT